MRVIGGVWSDETDACAGKAKQRSPLVEAKAEQKSDRRKRYLGAEWRLSEYKRKEMTAGKAPQAILRVIHNSLNESDSEGTYSILEPFALVLALAKCSPHPSPSP